MVYSLPMNDLYSYCNEPSTNLLQTPKLSHFNNLPNYRFEVNLRYLLDHIQLKTGESLEAMSCKLKKIGLQHV